MDIRFRSEDDSTGHSESKKKKVDRRTGGKTILKSRQKWALPAQQVQLKAGQGEKGCCEVICDAPTILQGYDIEPAIAAMHGPLGVVDIGHCTVTHCDGGGLSLINQ